VSQGLSTRSRRVGTALAVAPATAYVRADVLPPRSRPIVYDPLPDRRALPDRRELTDRRSGVARRSAADRRQMATAVAVERRRGRVRRAGVERRVRVRRSGAVRRLLPDRRRRGGSTLA